MANVRIRRFVQNGIVTKNSHMFRVSGGRVAMKYAVGKPRTNAVSVVKKIIEPTAKELIDVHLQSRPCRQIYPDKKQPETTLGLTIPT